MITAMARAPLSTPPTPLPRSTLLAALAAGLLLGCASSGPTLDTRHPAQGQDSRVQFIVLHYTSEPLADALRILTTQDVSAHYLIGDQAAPVVYLLVDEGRRAWHAGDSAWQGQTALNASSIGIEIVNPGPQRQADGSTRYAPYAAAQIDTLIGLLRDIQRRHPVRPDRIVGHSDIAPQRKLDPGPAFPWQRLAAAGLVPWPDPARVAAWQARHRQQAPDAAWVQAALARIGHPVPAHGRLDEDTRRVVAAFQMRYRPARHDGQPDAETTALMQVLAWPEQPAPQAQDASASAPVLPPPS